MRAPAPTLRPVVRRFATGWTLDAACIKITTSAHGWSTGKRAFALTGLTAPPSIFCLVQG